MFNKVFNILFLCPFQSKLCYIVSQRSIYPRSQDKASWHGKQKAGCIKTNIMSGVAHSVLTHKVPTKPMEHMVTFQIQT